MNIYEIMTKSAYDLTQEKAKHENLVNFASVLPDIEYKNISLISAYADGSVVVEIETRKDVEKVTSLFPPVDLVRVDNGYAAIQPKCRVPEQDKNCTSDIGPICFKMQDWAREIRKDFSWYCQVGDQLVEVTARVKDDPAHYDPAHSYNGRGQVSQYGWRTVSLPGTNKITHSNSHAPQTPNIVLSYWDKECSLEEILDLL